MGLFDANNVKCAEIRKLVEEQQYRKALDLLRKININKVKSTADLNVFAHLYQKSRMYEEARDVLYRIYEKRPNKRVIYKLVYLAILVSDFEEAEALYEEYVELAEGTVEQYILRYALDKAQRKDYNVRIQSLLKIKELDYAEEWSYELAKTYHKAGMVQECVNECTDIILWFGTGKIVEKATLLRAYYVDGAEVLHSYGITLNEKGEYYYDEATAQAYYKTKYPMTSAGQDTQNLSAQISYITEQQRQVKLHNELTKDLEPTMDIHQAMMQEMGDNPVFQEELRHMIGGSVDTIEIPYQEYASSGKQEVGKIQKMEEGEPLDDAEPSAKQQVYEEQLLDLSNMEEPNVKKALKKRKKQKDDIEDIQETVSADELFEEIEQMSEEKTVKRSKISLFSKKRKKKCPENDSRLIQLPREEAKQMIEQEELQQPDLKKEKNRVEEAMKMEEEFLEDMSNTKTLFRKLRGKNMRAKEKSAAIEKEQNILASLAETPLLKEEWNESSASIEVPEKITQMKESETVEKENVKAKKTVKEKPKRLTRKEWLEKTKEVSQKVEELRQEGKAKEESVIGETISIKIKPKDTSIIIDGIDLTENFGDYKEQPRIRAQLLKELTRMKEGDRPIHILLSGKNDEQTMDFIRSMGKAIKIMGVLTSHRISSIDAEKLNKIQLAEKQDGLKNGCVAIKSAGKITADTAQSILDMIEKFEEEIIVILVDQNAQLDFLMVEYPALAKYFKYSIAI